MTESASRDRVAKSQAWRQLVKDCREFGMPINLVTINNLADYVIASDKKIEEINYRRAVQYADPSRSVTEVSEDHWSQNPSQI
jgi:hypothetical protein